MAIVIGAGVVVAVVLLTLVLRRASERADPLAADPAALGFGGAAPASPIEGERAPVLARPARPARPAAPVPPRSPRTFTYQGGFDVDIGTPPLAGAAPVEGSGSPSAGGSAPAPAPATAPTPAPAGPASPAADRLSAQLGPVGVADTKERIGPASGVPLSAALREVSLPDHLAPVTGSVDPAEWDRRFMLASDRPLADVRADLEQAFAAAGYEARWFGDLRANFVRPGRGVCATLRPPMDERGWVEHKIEADLPKVVGKAALWLLASGPREWDPFPGRVGVDPRHRPLSRADLPTVKLGATVVELTPI